MCSSTSTLFPKPLCSTVQASIFLDDLLSPDDIIYEGSRDHEGVAQIIRIHEKAEEYHRGAGIYILSALLFGPVMNNPWKKKKSFRSTANFSTTTILASAKPDSRIFKCFSSWNSSSITILKGTDSLSQGKTPFNPQRRHYPWELPFSPGPVDVAQRFSMPVAVSDGIKCCTCRLSHPLLLADPPSPVPLATLTLNSKRLTEVNFQHHVSPEILRHDKFLDAITVTPDVEWNRKRPTINFPPIDETVTASDEETRRKKLRITPLANAMGETGREFKRLIPWVSSTSVEAAQGKVVPKPEITKSATKERLSTHLTPNTKCHGTQKSKPRDGDIHPSSTNRYAEHSKGTSKEGTESPLFPAVKVARKHEKGINKFRVGDDIRRHVFGSYISNILCTEDLSVPPVPTSHSLPQTNLPLNARKPNHLTPCQWSQAQLLAAQSGFFNTITDSPIRFDLYLTPQTRHDRDLVAECTTLHRKGSTRILRRPSHRPWSVLPTPFSICSSIREPGNLGQHPHLESLPLTSPRELRVNDMARKGFIVDDTSELTLSRNFATPNAPPERRHKTGGRYSTRNPVVSNNAFINFPVLRSSSSSFSTKKLLGNTSESEGAKKLDLNSTPKVNNFMLLDHAPHRCFNFEATLPNAAIPLQTTPIQHHSSTSSNVPMPRVKTVKDNVGMIS